MGELSIPLPRFTDSFMCYRLQLLIVNYLFSTCVMVGCPWPNKEVTYPESLSFEDSFTSSDVTPPLTNGSKYVPLPDSDHYLSHLKGRLAKVAGSNTTVSRKDLIDSMVGMRDLHNHSLLNNHAASPVEEEPEEASPEGFRKGIVRKGCLAEVVGKLDPEKLAITTEELICLLGPTHPEGGQGSQNEAEEEQASQNRLEESKSSGNESEETQTPQNKLFESQ